VATKTVWMISGNKGGVGKSLFCLALASALEMRGMQYAIFDGDGRTGDVYTAFLRKRPARQGDFRLLRPESHDCTYDAQYEMMLHQLLAGSDHLIVNTPDGADSVLMKWFDVTLRHTETNNCHFKFMYLMSDRPDGLTILKDLAERFSFLYPVRNLNFGGRELFTAFNRDYWTEFHDVIDFKALRGDEVRMLFDLNTYPAQALELRGKDGAYSLPVLVRARLQSWQHWFNERIDDIIENNDVPNLKNSSWKKKD